MAGPDRTPDTTGKISRLDRKRMYWAHRADGQNITDSAAFAGIAKQTAFNWERRKREGKDDITSSVTKSNGPMSKDDVLLILRDILKDEDQSGAYRTAAARLLLTPDADTPAKQHVPKSVVEWLEGLDDRLDITQT